MGSITVLNKFPINYNIPLRLLIKMMRNIIEWTDSNLFMFIPNLKLSYSQLYGQCSMLDTKSQSLSWYGTNKSILWIRFFAHSLYRYTIISNNKHRYVSRYSVATKFIYSDLTNKKKRQERDKMYSCGCFLIVCVVVVCIRLKWLQ